MKSIEDDTEVKIADFGLSKIIDKDKMMQTVIDELPDATIVSVAHRAELEAFHSRKITLERREGGAKLVSDIDLIPRKARGSMLRRIVKRR